MWGKDKTKKVDFDRHAGKTTMIAKGTVIDGDVRFEGGLLVEGTIKGNVRADDGSEALLRLSEAGKIEGEIHVPNVVVNGKVNGDVHSSAHVELAAKAVVNGNVHYHLIEMVMGAEVNGSLVHSQQKPAVEEVAITLDKKAKKDEKPSGLNAKMETKQSPA
ncbi:MAG: cell shape-determining protein CcmA [Pseudomonadales bacterium]|jgi:cytoskeletal protein CcmA (bactofilin family)|uniref:bactofilin family protein n=1 Tax=unclassified Ketobacter TaxID=2639109 RepID=UPI000C576158|nr:MULTISPECIES: polymer-forming cytoskeletal protein [unclassified Ketobacter]MAA58984.1 cell shape-determining protein CcmA [Pseudomonadales bacterium]MEC8811970.1 polymer-forming cytoskeletal protein [Pseudomonadota bacterium]TNC88148.1 MAG: cell shape-determining protein CcmA [Alcanivorax sp.]HAG95252.1 cell shape-determining protein CcmA [Gammaproteobacteria bacterium]MAQ26537.1 cell shape-determining protein CcmA [Pseudomonadales bacterium]|tara:strand:- start:921 stop:1403 length:483 start_codon:yes stop_codon:yes gene_type:complete